MATKAYNGATLMVVKDITKLRSQYALCQAGRTFTVYSKDSVTENYAQLLDDATEVDEYYYWYNAHLSGD